MSYREWNLGDRVQSSDFQYLLYCVSLREKHELLEKQHTDEMALLRETLALCMDARYLILGNLTAIADQSEHAEKIAIIYVNC